MGHKPCLVPKFIKRLQCLILVAKTESSQPHSDALCGLVASLEAMYSEMEKALCSSRQMSSACSSMLHEIYNFKLRYPPCLRNPTQQKELDQLLEQRSTIASGIYRSRYDLLEKCRDAYAIVKEVILMMKHEHTVQLSFDSKLRMQWERYDIKCKCVRCFSFLSSGVLEHIEKGTSDSGHMCPKCRRHLDSGSPCFLGPPKPSPPPPPPPVLCGFRFQDGRLCKVNVAVVQFHGHCPYKNCDGEELEGHQCLRCGRWPC
jgi:hypothetical protein